MSQATFEVPATLGADLDPRLYRHVKRPQWGVGIMVREGEDTRSYQFEDGQLRKVQKGYYKLLEPVEDLGERGEYIRENLLSVVGAKNGDSQRKVQEAACPFSAQVALFKGLYPGGFEDPAWIKEHRRTDGTPLKRHRTPVSAEAQESLSAERCREALASGNQVGLLEVIAGILTRTDFVPISHPKALRSLDPDDKKEYVESIVDLLHGEGNDEERFRAYLGTHKRLFGDRPSWRIATTLPGLVHPQTQAVVRRSAFLRQAGSVAPTAHYTERASMEAYGNFRRVAVRVRERLNEAGLEPRDLLDVHDFIWTTLRTSALKQLDSGNGQVTPGSK